MMSSDTLVTCCMPGLDCSTVLSSSGLSSMLCMTGEFIIAAICSSMFCPPAPA